MQISCLSLLHTMCHSNVMEQDNSIKTEKSMVISYSSPRYPLHSAQCLDKKRMGADTANGNVSLLQIWLSACTAEKNKTLSIKFEDAASRNPTKMTKILSECMTWLAHCYSQPTFFHMGRKYCIPRKSYGWFTEFFLCASRTSVEISSRFTGLLLNLPSSVFKICCQSIN